MVVVDPKTLEVVLEGQEVLLEEMMVVMEMKVTPLLVVEEVMALWDHMLDLLVVLVVLEYKLHRYSKIQLLHHNQDQLVEEETEVVSGAVEAFAVQPSAAPARGRPQLLLRLNRASRQSSGVRIKQMWISMYVGGA